MEYKINALKNMNRFPSHKELERIGRLLLRGMGFAKHDIHTEYEVKIGKYKAVVDIVGTNSDRSVAVELGQCGWERLIQLKAVFDEVIWLPYWTTILGSAKFPDYEKKIKELQEELTETRKELNDAYHQHFESKKVAQIFATHTEHVIEGLKHTNCILCDSNFISDFIYKNQQKAMQAHYVSE